MKISKELDAFHSQDKVSGAAKFTRDVLLFLPSGVKLSFSRDPFNCFKVSGGSDVTEGKKSNNKPKQKQS